MTQTAAPGSCACRARETDRLGGGGLGSMELADAVLNHPDWRRSSVSCVMSADPILGMAHAHGCRRPARDADRRRAAGVSRMTVYRRYPWTCALWQALMTREFEAASPRPTARRRPDHRRRAGARGRDCGPRRRAARLAPLVRAPAPTLIPSSCCPCSAEPVGASRSWSSTGGDPGWPRRWPTGSPRSRTRRLSACHLSHARVAPSAHADAPEEERAHPPGPAHARSDAFLAP